MEKRKTVEIPVELMEPEWKTNTVVVKRLLGPERWDINDEAANLRVSESGASARPSQKTLIAGYILRGVVEAPWPVRDIGAVNSLDQEMWDFLREEIDSINMTLRKKKEPLSDSSAPETSAQ